MATCVQNKNPLEWEDLDEKGRNCLTWPEFMEWGPEIDVEIKKTSVDGDMGFITTIKQIGETCFNIITQVTEGSPVSQCLKQFDWVTTIDGKPTTTVKESKEFKILTKNGQIKVRLSFRRASNPLTNIKRWSHEREVKIEVSPKLGFRLAHFYSNVKNDNIKDHILISKLEPGTDQKSKPYKYINRGDELLSVNGQLLTGKKLKDIYALFLNKSNTVVTLQVKMILHGKEFQEMLGKMALKYPDQIYWMHEKREIMLTVSQESTGLGLRFISRNNSERDEFFHIVSKVIEDKPAAKENICVGSRLLSVNDCNITCLKKEEAAELMRKNEGELKLVIATPEGIKEQSRGPRKKRCSLSRMGSESESSTSTGSPQSEDRCESESGAGSISCNVISDPKSLLMAGISKTTCVTVKPVSPLKKHHRAAAIEEQENKAFEGSGNEEPDQFCKDCILKNTTKKTCRLPDDKLKWPLKDMEPLTFDELCKELERDVPFTDINIRFVAAHLPGFTQKIIEEIVQGCSSHGGKGAGRCVLQRWMEPEPRRRTVGELLEMLKKIERGDAVYLIKEWLLKDNRCNGCGALVNTI